MWVAQITEPAEQGEHDEQYAFLTERFPAYRFSIIGAAHGRRVIIARPHPETIKFPEDEATELDMLRFIITELINEQITGHLITDDQELVAPPLARSLSDKEFLEHLARKRDEKRALVALLPLMDPVADELLQDILDDPDMETEA